MIPIGIQYREMLFKRFRELAAGHTPEHIVDVLYAASDDIFNAGLDQMHVDMADGLDREKAFTFDITWLTAVCIRLSTSI